MAEVDTDDDADAPPAGEDDEPGALETTLSLAVLGGMGYGGYRIVAHRRGRAGSA